MTEKNALRHYLSKAHKAKKRQNYEEMHRIYNEATDILRIDICHKCMNDDFGYCDLRNTNISYEEKFAKYCYDGFIREMKRMLNAEK